MSYKHTTNEPTEKKNMKKEEKKIASNEKRLREKLHIFYVTFCVWVVHSFAIFFFILFF